MVPGMKLRTKSPLVAELLAGLVKLERLHVDAPLVGEVMTNVLALNGEALVQVKTALLSTAVPETAAVTKSASLKSPSPVSNRRMKRIDCMSSSVSLSVTEIVSVDAT